MDRIPGLVVVEMAVHHLELVFRPVSLKNRTEVELLLGLTRKQNVVLL
jgi:hypothetical protein